LQRFSENYLAENRAVAWPVWCRI